MLFLRRMILANGSMCDRWVQEEGGRHVHAVRESLEKRWVAKQVGGVEIVDGERRYVRRWVARKAGELEMARMVYDYVGKVGE